LKITLLIAVLLFSFSSVGYAASCKRDYLTCKQVVIAWCEGKHPRADGDKDGIPYENLCSSLKQVEDIKKEIGCKK
jgi:hypothetical protein